VSQPIVQRPRRTDRRPADAARPAGRPPFRPRPLAVEPLEPRCLLSISPVVVGTVYIEEDHGTDLHGDTFVVSFRGGAAGTQLTRLVIDGDQAEPGFGLGDVFFDTDVAPPSEDDLGRGADHAFPLTIISRAGIDDVRSSVVDGTSLLVLEFTGFDAGETLVFSIDVDEVEEFDPRETDPEVFNAGFDPITSGVEFQRSMLSAFFRAPHYDDASATGVFFNRYDELLDGTGLDLPPDNVDGKRDRTAGAIGRVEQRPQLAELSGHVYHDRNQNGLREEGEEGLAGVVIQLVPRDTLLPPSTVTVVTAADGTYHATGLVPGNYDVVQPRQPAGYLDGLDAAGTVLGQVRGQAVNPGDVIRQVELHGGEAGVDYNFGELLPGSLEGLVYADPNQNCRFDHGELPLEGVLVELLDDQGRQLDSTRTDAAGRYRFDALPPGSSTLREHQPDGYFHGGQQAGSGGGDDRARDLISRISVGSGQRLVDYNFCELPPATIAGFVFQDGPAIGLLPGQTLPDNLTTLRDGLLTPDDTRLEGVVLELRDGTTGLAISADTALAGFYLDGPLVAITDAHGHYQFSGLPPGNYAVYEVQPAGWRDGIDTPGPAGGIAVNRHAPPAAEILARLLISPRDDAILRIPLAAGAAVAENNFSEIRVEPIPVQPPPAPAPPLPWLTLPELMSSPAVPRPVQPPPRYIPATYGNISAGVVGYTWHLSVTNAGQPRGSGQAATDAGPFWLTAVNSRDHAAWTQLELRGGRWLLGDEQASDTRVQQRTFGLPGARAVAGDFNGDGLAETGVYYQGQWFVDLNGNGVWDEGDLWARLGYEGDTPVVGDWDGDGKDDIGVFGPARPGDPDAVAVEPGLPDRQNRYRPELHRQPPPADVPQVVRVMKRTVQGALRADAVDHVFHFGSAWHQPVAGDWNGDGIDTAGVFHDGRWKLDEDGDGRWTAADRGFTLGQPDDMAIAGDFNGDGIDEVGVYRDGRFLIDSNRNGRLDADDLVWRIDAPHGRPVVGDWDGDGIDEVGVYLENSGHTQLEARRTDRVPEAR